MRLIVVTLVGILAVIAVLFAMAANNASFNAENSQVIQRSSSQPIKGAKDLDTTKTDLDNTNLDSLDQGLNQLNNESATFGPRIRLRNGTSTNWAGYAVETNLSNPQKNAVSDVKGSWIVPTVNCTSTPNAYSATWIGIDGNSNNTVEQIGTSQDCRNGTPTYYAWFEMYPKPARLVNMAVNAGDVLSAEVKYNGNNQFLLTLTNVGTGASFSTTQKGKALRQSAEWIIEAPWSGGVLPLANFGIQSFSNAQATVNGHTGLINDPAWQNDAITMITPNANATPSGLTSDSSGSNFNVTWTPN